MSRRPPRKELDRLRRKMADDIARTGRSVIGIFPDRDSKDPLNDAFLYSIGNAAKGLPELLLVGMYSDTFPINRLSELMIERGRAFEDGEVVPLGGEHPVCVVDADEGVKDRYTIQASNMFGREGYRVQQVVFPDMADLFPWQPGCAEPYSRVRVWRARGLQ
jgi:hypothetical protein